MLLEPLSGVFGRLMTELKRRLDDGESAVLVRSFADTWSVAGRRLERMTDSELGDGKVRMAQGREGGILTAAYHPAPRLLLFGATDDAVPLAELAARNGFRVFVGDWREGLCTADRFPRAHRFIGSPEAWMEEVGVAERDYAVVMSHHFPKDRELVGLLVGRKLKYAGIMGSVTRTGRSLDGFPVPEWLHYPAGLRIGAEGPAEIAVSIMAELIRVRRQGGLREGRNEACGGGGNRDLFGGRSQPEDGPLQALHRARGWRKARRFSP
ncbi:XdhC family protein [Paenibacillus sp. P25]|nr:XdhC family protein [Paenibacillus sp. P25]